MLHNTYFEMLVVKIYRHFNIKSRNYFEDPGLDRFCMNSVFNLAIKDCTAIIYVVRS